MTPLFSTLPLEKGYLHYRAAWRSLYPLGLAPQLTQITNEGFDAGSLGEKHLNYRPYGGKRIRLFTRPDHDGFTDTSYIREVKHRRSTMHQHLRFAFEQACADFGIDLRRAGNSIVISLPGVGLFYVCLKQQNCRPVKEHDLKLHLIRAEKIIDDLWSDKPVLELFEMALKEQFDFEKPQGKRLPVLVVAPWTDLKLRDVFYAHVPRYVPGYRHELLQYDGQHVALYLLYRYLRNGLRRFVIFTYKRAFGLGWRSALGRAGINPWRREGYSKIGDRVIPTTDRALHPAQRDLMWLNYELERNPHFFNVFPEQLGEPPPSELPA